MKKSETTEALTMKLITTIIFFINYPINLRQTTALRVKAGVGSDGAVFANGRFCSGQRDSVWVQQV